MTPNEQYIRFIKRSSYIRWDGVHFILVQHAEFGLYSASSLKQQSVDGHVAPLALIILIPIQPVFALTPWSSMFSEEARSTNFIGFYLTRPGINPWSIALETSTLTITPPMRFSPMRLVCRLFKYSKTSTHQLDKWIPGQFFFILLHHSNHVGL